MGPLRLCLSTRPSRSACPSSELLFLIVLVWLCVGAAPCSLVGVGPRRFPPQGCPSSTRPSRSPCPSSELLFLIVPVCLCVGAVPCSLVGIGPRSRICGPAVASPLRLHLKIPTSRMPLKHTSLKIPISLKCVSVKISMARPCLGPVFECSANMLLPVFTFQMIF